MTTVPFPPQGASEPFLKQIVSRLEEETFMPEMIIANANDVVQEAYFIVKGEANVCLPVPLNLGGGVELAIRLGPGSHVGGDAFFCQSLQPWTVVASEATLVVKLTQEDRRTLQRDFPTDYRLVRLVVTFFLPLGVHDIQFERIVCLIVGTCKFAEPFKCSPRRDGCSERAPGS